LAIRDKVSDPKDYYGILDVPLDADADAIKLAFRTRAKRLHPDRNPAPQAAKQFSLLNEAYSVLSDPERRKAYHLKAAAKAKDKTKPQPEPKTRPKPKAPPRPEAPPRSSARTPPPKAHFHVCKSCGILSAQPRVVVFQEVTGRPFAVIRETISGVYCPRCAADVSIHASLNTWVKGMVAIPKGPFFSLKALWHNLRGGDKPVEANARMLLSQARAFLGRGDVDLARATIAQALPFAEKTIYRHEAETLLASLNVSSQKTLKSQWSVFGKGLWLQLAPFAVVFVIVASAMTVSLTRNKGESPLAQPPVILDIEPKKTLVLMPVGPNTPLPTYVTIHDKVPLRSSPSKTSVILTYIAKNTKVTMTAIVPQEKWAQVRVGDGRLGFVHLDDLK